MNNNVNKIGVSKEEKVYVCENEDCTYCKNRFLCFTTNKEEVILLHSTHGLFCVVEDNVDILTRAQILSIIKMRARLQGRHNGKKENESSW